MLVKINLAVFCIAGDFPAKEMSISAFSFSHFSFIIRAAALNSFVCSTLAEMFYLQLLAADSNDLLISSYIPSYIIDLLFAQQ